MGKRNSAELKLKVLTLWKEGLSAGVIASRLSITEGPHVTRNVVIGIIHRLRQNGFDADAVRKPGPKPKPKTVSNPKPKAPKKPPPLPEARLDEPTHLFVPLHGLTQQVCHWPKGDGVGEPYSFCGQPVEYGSYCMAHRQRAVRKTQTPV